MSHEHCWPAPERQSISATQSPSNNFSEPWNLNRIRRPSISLRGSSHSHEALSQIPRSLFESALDKDPTSLDAMHWLAIAEHRSGDEASARAQLDEILSRNPNYLPALTDKMEFAADRNAWGIALLAQLNRMAVMPDPPASEYCRLGAIWMKTVQYEGG